MAKSISAQLLADIQKSVTTLAVCIEITRKDGKTYRLTNHDQEVVFNGLTFTNTVPFNISAIDSGSQMAIDNMSLMLFCDGDTFVADNFRDGLFDYSEVTIFFVDYENTSHGKMTMRKGWFGRIERNSRNLVDITITGLLKVLDFETGRVYQPTCDADLGDSRCRVAINLSQAYSHRNRYRAGDWVYYYDEALMTAVTLTNGGFEADGSRAENQTITGWTKGTASAFFVQNTPTSPTYGVISNDPDPVVGTYALYGSDDATDDDSGFENFLYKTVTLNGSAGADVAGIANADIDDGKIMMKYTVAIATSVYLLDPLKLRVELFDANGDFVSSFDSGWQFLDVINTWRDRSIVFPVYPGARTARFYIYMRKEDGVYANCAADDVRIWYWDHTAGTPYDDVVHRVSRLITFDDSTVKKPKNPSFEANGNVTNADNPTITDWTTGAGNWWYTDNVVGVLSVEHGSYFLIGGNDGSGVQKTYTITQTATLAQMTKFDASRLALGKYVARFRLNAYFADAGLTNATVKLEVKNSSNVVLDTFYLYNNSSPGSVGIATPYVDFALPPTTNKFTITLQVITPTGSSNGNKLAFDDVRFWFTDAERPVRTDPVSATGDDSTIWNTVAGDYTPDGNINWKALSTFLDYDEVAAVTSRKQFTATGMAGDDGTYETGIIWWISGANAGLKNIIRTWDEGSLGVKMYFQEPYDIAVGDRFIYIRSCQKRFGEDCVTIFQNAINFRGFPHLPGKLDTEESMTETPTTNPETPA